MKEKKIKKEVILSLSIGVIALLYILGSTSYAFYTANIENKKEENKTTTMSTAELVEVTMDYGNQVNSNGMLPGHKVMKTITVKGKGGEQSTPIPFEITLTPHIEDFPNHVKYKIYKVENSQIEASSLCKEAKEITNEGKYYEEMECETSELGEVIKEGIFTNEQVEKIGMEVTYETNTTYYILIEYINDETKDQNSEQGKEFTIEFGYEGETKNYMVDYLATLAQESEELVYDGTVDNNLRYIGTNPNNYIKFNNELWRIIGVMNNVEDRHGNINKYIKIIRNESIGNYYWSGSSENQTNDWTKSTLNTELNGNYYNGLLDSAKKMISNVVWHLGGQSTFAAPVNTFYNAERGNQVYNGRPTTWTGKIGMIYASDYGYAVGKNVRNTCLATELSIFHTNDCYTNDWLYLSGVQQCTLTLDSSYDNRAFQIHNLGVVSSYNVHDYTLAVRPSLYLSPNIKLIGDGNGSTTKPFEISLY